MQALRMLPWSLSESISTLVLLCLRFLVSLIPSMPSDSHSLSASSSVRFPGLWREGFAGDTPFRCECSKLSHFTCILSGYEWVSGFVSIYCRRRLLWSWLGKALIYELANSFYCHVPFLIGLESVTFAQPLISPILCFCLVGWLALCMCVGRGICLRKPSFDERNNLCCTVTVHRNLYIEQAQNVTEFCMFLVFLFPATQEANQVMSGFCALDRLFLLNMFYWLYLKCALETAVLSWPLWEHKS